MTNALLMRNVSFAYPQKPPVFHGVNLTVAKGRVAVLMGANGSGKTTLLRIAAGLARPTSGDASTGDGTPTPVAMRLGRIGFIPQQLGLIHSASVMDNVLIGGLRRAGPLSILGIHPSDVRDRAEGALDLVNLREKAQQPAKKLSGGERQRVAIARTLVQQPSVIVADELIASLDAVHQQAILQLARDLTKRGTALLLALHQIDLALTNADEIAFLRHGAISQPKRPADLTPEEARSAIAT